MVHQAVIKLNFNGSLIMGHCPSPLSLSRVSRKLHRQGYAKSSVESFGLFDSNAANYITYYPNVKAKDLKPKAEEFINPVFRALSEVIVHKLYNPIDFGKRNVLKKSTNLLMGSTVNVDHETAVGNAIGSVSEVFWEEGYKSHNGVLVPAGINARMLIDGKSHPMISRKIMMNPPAIHSTSVTVQFLWEKSHPGMSHDDFLKSLGTYDKNKRLIRRIVTDVKNYHEISLVSHGADPFAQRVNDNGEINNPLYADISYNTMKPSEKRKQTNFFFDYKSDIILNKEKTTIPKNLYINNSSKTPRAMNKLISILCVMLGLQSIDPKSPEDLASVRAQLRELKKNSKLRASERKELKALRAGNKELETSKEKVARLTKFRSNIIEKLRKEVMRNYKLTASNDPDSKVVRMIEKADYVTLQGLNANYQKDIKKKFQDSCADCGGHNITRASAAQTEAEESNRDQYPVDNFDKLSKMLDEEESDKSFAFMHDQDEKKPIKKPKEEEPA